MSNHYMPTQRMIRTLFESHGFWEYKDGIQLNIGGRVFFRRHPDGRLQAAYAFSWSNFKVAEQQHIAPCIYWVRVTTDAGDSEENAWESSRHGAAIGIGFLPKEWDSVVKGMEKVVMPLFNASRENYDSAIEKYTGEWNFMGIH